MLKMFSIIIFIVAFISLVSSALIKQEIEGGNAEYTTTSTTYTPTTPQTGLVPVNISKYANVSAVYFEVTSRANFSGIPNSYGEGYVQLYDDNSSAIVTNSELYISTPAYLLYRTENLSYFWTNKNAMVYAQIKTGNVDSTEILRSWRVIIIQNGGISSTITYIPIGDNNAYTNTGYTDITYPKYWIYNPNNYDGTLTVKFCATISNSTATTMYAELNYTNGTVISGSEVSTNGASKEVFNCSNSLTIANGNLTTNVKINGGTSGILRNAFLVIEQNGMNLCGGKIEMVMQLTNSLFETGGTTSYYPSKSFNSYNDSDWNGITMIKRGEYVFKKAPVGVATVTSALTIDSGGTRNVNDSEISTNLITYSLYQTPSNISLSSDYESNYIGDKIKTTSFRIPNSLTSGRIVITLTNIGTCWVYNSTTREYYLPSSCKCYCNTAGYFKLENCNCQPI